MGYKFVKTLDPENEYDTSNITVEIPYNDITLDDLKEVFKDFVTACGFHPESEEEE
jgi:hypothetical protein